MEKWNDGASRCALTGVMSFPATFGTDFGNCLVHRGAEDVLVGGLEGFVYLEETPDGMGGEGEDAQGLEVVQEGFVALGALINATNEDTQEEDLVIELGVAGVEVFNDGTVEAAGVEAVLESVAVAGLPAAFAFYRRLGLETVVFFLFVVVRIGEWDDVVQLV
jgi:hypothetical protein